MSADPNELDRSSLVAALRNYLPISLQRQCLTKQAVQAPEACAQHLNALLHTVSTYLPRQVVAPLLADPVRGRVEGSFVYGTVMFADISGFTAMSERLSQLGKAGAEEITAIVNRFFTSLLQVTDRYGGDLVKFGGDALLVYVNHIGTDYVDVEPPGEGIVANKVNVLSFHIQTAYCRPVALEVFGRVVLEGPPGSQEHAIHFRTDTLFIEIDDAEYTFNILDHIDPGLTYTLVRPKFPTNEYTPFEGTQGMVKEVTITEVWAVYPDGERVSLILGDIQ